MSVLDQIKISFLIPTRKRVEQCIFSINKIIELSINKNTYEFLLAFDEDDETRNIIIDYLSVNGINHKYIVTPRYGYHSLHNYYNELYKISRGKYLWGWNDDAFILTKGWDDILINNINPNRIYDVYIFKSNDIYNKIAPLINKELVNYFGYISLNTHYDSWIDQLIQGIIPYYLIDQIEIFHNDKVNNVMNIDYSEVLNSNSISSPEFSTPRVQTLINNDNEKLKWLVSYNEKKEKNVFIKLMNVAGVGYYIKHENTGLGNILFQVASGMSYAIKHNANLNIIDLNNYENIEEISKPHHILRKINFNIDYNNYKKFNNLIISDSSNEKYIFDYDFYDNMVISNHFENYKNFEEIKHLIMYCFSPTQENIDYILSKYPFVLDNDICSINIRMGPDYRSIFSQEEINTFEERYKTCIDHMINVKSIKTFFVFTNDKQYSKLFITSLQYKDINFVYSDEKDYIDIWIISLIKNNIVSMSTLSWWGSYLNKNSDKYIICCKGNRDNLHYIDWKVI